MVMLVSVLVSVLSNFFIPVGGTATSTEGSERFGLIVDDPRSSADERSFVSWQHCP